MRVEKKERDRYVSKLKKKKKFKVENWISIIFALLSSNF